LARAIATGISAGTERIRYNGTNPAYVTGRRSYPEEPGYEFVGEVTEIGKNITSVATGDKIFALAPHCEYVAFREFDFFGVLPNEIDVEDALFAALTMSTIHVAHRCNIALGDTVGVVGLGVFGLLIAQIAKLNGASKVIGLNPSDWKTSFAKKMGIDLILKTNSYRPQLLSETQSRGVDIAIESSGYSSGVTIAVDIVRKRGKVAIVGFHTHPFEISGEHLFIKELTILGIRNGGGPDMSYEYLRWSKRENFNEALRLIKSGLIQGKPMITHRFKADDIEKAYQLIDKRAEPYLQVILNW